ncbi:MAG TPA: outer membrane beta-barrel protein [Xanthobacteraceae bacterium]|nr:outer membrane beta-barrel protein [Xanthobacteraceae bacterium]
MKKLLLASAPALLLLSGTAKAADYGYYKSPPVYAPPPASYAPPAPYAPPAAPYQDYSAPPPVFCWTGFYIGGNMGAAWVQGNVTDDLGLNFNNGNNNIAFIGGGQMGFNYQIYNIVFGGEWDFDWVANNNNPANGVAVPGAGVLQVSANDAWISTLAARFGVAYDRWLIYGKAGAGWVGVNNFTVTNLTNGVSVSGGSNNNGNSGWLLGAGVEWAFAGNWSAKMEYNYLGLASRTFASPGLILPDDVFISNPNIQMVKFGINYKFGLDLPAFKY